MALEFDFDEQSERIQIVRYDPNKMDAVNEKKSNPRKILESLKGDKLPIGEISEITGIDKEVCKTTLYRLLKSQKVLKIGEDWGLAFHE
jgi:DNA-directed RNA polymerase specialized sigma24 family protein